MNSIQFKKKFNFPLRIDEFIYRDVILITDDMNLRIKSLGFDVPVKKFKQFRKWANTLDHHQPTASKS